MPVVLATAAFVGAIMVLQAATYVRRYGVYDMVGWYSGLTTFREVGPLLVALMLSGRVGAMNTAELARMAVDDQLDAYRALAVDVTGLLILPRVAGIAVATVCLTALADLISVGSGALAAGVLLDLSATDFWRSLVTGLRLGDVAIGLFKAGLFGLCIGGVSCAYGISASGGAAGVGRAVRRQMVAATMAIFGIDYGVSFL